MENRPIPATPWVPADQMLRPQRFTDDTYSNDLSRQWTDLPHHENLFQQSPYFVANPGQLFDWPPTQGLLQPQGHTKETVNDTGISKNTPPGQDAADLDWSQDPTDFDWSLPLDVCQFLEMRQDTNREYMDIAQSPMLASSSNDATDKSKGCHSHHIIDCDPVVEPVDSPASNSSHGHLRPGTEMTCQKCDTQFATRASLQNHAKETQHAPYICMCTKTFSRLDVLNRHTQIFNPEVSFACPYCQKYRGPRSFSRRDHLAQHLRGFHNIESLIDPKQTLISPPVPRLKKKLTCPHEDCLYHEGSGFEISMSGPRVQRPSFQSQSEYTSHLREVHDESLFSCMALGCARKGGKGFFRKRDLLKHMQDHHSYLPS